MFYRTQDLEQLVSDFGKALTLNRKNTSASYNPATGSLDNQSEVGDPCRGYFYKQKLGVGETGQVVRGTRMCVIPYGDLSSAPNTKDTITASNGDTKVIFDVETIDYKDTPVCYLLHLSE